jgi:hypothetical protein
MVREDGTWRYDPNGNSITASVANSSNPNCP